VVVVLLDATTLRIARSSQCVVHQYCSRINLLKTFSLSEAVLPDRALCLPTFSHFLIVNKTFSLSLSLSLSRARALALALFHFAKQQGYRIPGSSLLTLRGWWRGSRKVLVVRRRLLRTFKTRR
jgi:hypothetical protein